MDETYVPGLNSKKHQPAQEIVEQPQPLGVSNISEESETPVVGFLYSLSRGGEPEWWPLHIGQNKIGKAADMDICLSERSISSHHANINLKRLRRKGNSLAASIVDIGSKTGIILNDEELDYEPRTLKNEDIVTFGLNYKCVVILVDPTKYGLEESSEFIPAAKMPKVRKSIELDQELEEDPFSGLDSTTSDTIGKFDPNATISVNGGIGIDLSGGGTKIL